MWAVCAAGGGGGVGGRLSAPVIVVYDAVCGLCVLQEAVEALVAEYLRRFSEIAGPLINCAPILNWFELDNRGSRLLGGDESDINTPAVAAALVGKRYVAQAGDEISLEVRWAGQGKGMELVE